MATFKKEGVNNYTKQKCMNNIKEVNFKERPLSLVVTGLEIILRYQFSILCKIRPIT
jgi:hypothetical protein